MIVADKGIQDKQQDDAAGNTHNPENNLYHIDKNNLGQAGFLFRLHGSVKIVALFRAAGKIHGNRA